MCGVFGVLFSTKYQCNVWYDRNRGENTYTWNRRERSSPHDSPTTDKMNHHMLVLTMLLGDTESESVDSGDDLRELLELDGDFQKTQ